MIHVGWGWVWVCGGNEYLMEYLEYIGGGGEGEQWCSVHQGFQYKLKAFSNYITTWIMISSWVANDIPHINPDIPLMYWTSSNVLMMSPWYTDNIPPVTEHLPPKCTHDITHMNQSWHTSEHPQIYSRDCPKCIHEIPLMKWVPFRHTPMYWTQIVQDDPWQPLLLQSIDD